MMNKDALKESLDYNKSLLDSYEKSSVLKNELLGMLRHIESIIPEKFRENFYENLRSMIILFVEDRSFALVDLPIINIDKKLCYLVEQNIQSDTTDFKELFLMMIFHELLHLASTTYEVVDGKVIGYSGFQNISATPKGGVKFENADEFNGLTEGFTQYLTEQAFGTADKSKYRKQIEAVKELIEKVGLNTVCEAYFNNRRGMTPINDALKKANENPLLCINLEGSCHLEALHVTGTKEVEENTANVRVGQIKAEEKAVGENCRGDLGIDENYAK